MHDAERESVRGLRDRPDAEVLVIGGGVNGLAVLRDLALQGVDAALVEAEDYAAGASSASSHMIHGGIRYLENGEFRLVRESVQERNRLLRIAAHAVRPLRTVVPIATFASGLLAAPLRMLTHRGRPRERGAALVKIGLTIYDFFSRGGGAVPRHRFAGPSTTRAEFPAFADRIRYSARYFDAAAPHPERLCLDLLHDAIGAGARAANRVRAVAVEPDRGVLLRDDEDGSEFAFSAKLVLNASGPWTDLTNRALGRPTTLLGGTKGSHIVVDHPELLAATGGAEIFFENRDGRIVLIYPLKGKVMIGTTDLDADPNEPAVCTEDEIDYFFDLVRLVFPDLLLDRSHIVYRFSGIRPLPRHGDLDPGFVSRDYRLVELDHGGLPVFSLVGGKLTTFRALGEHVSGRLLDRLGRRRTVDTRELPIGGGVGFPTDHASRASWIEANADGHPADRVDRLLDRYGTRCTSLLAAAAVERRLRSAPDYSAEEIEWLVRTEQVVRLADLVQRRTTLALEGRVSGDLLEELADVAGAALGWSEARRRREVLETAALLRDRHGVPGLVGAA